MHDKDYNFIVQKNRAEWSKLKAARANTARRYVSRPETVGESVSMSQPGESLLTHKFGPPSRATIFSSARGRRILRPTRPDKRPFRIYSRGRHRRPPPRIWRSQKIASDRGMASRSLFIIAGILTGAIVCAFRAGSCPRHTEKGGPRNSRRGPGILKISFRAR